MTDWLRLWHDMPTDPKWRAIARKSGQPLPCVIAVFNLLMVNASANAGERGTLLNWDCEDAAAALDMETDDVAAICEAMQGKVLDGNRLTGWEKRQPKREDGTAAERKAAWKERQAERRNASERTGTHRNAPETDTETDTEVKKENVGSVAPSPTVRAVADATAPSPAKIYPEDFENRFWQPYPRSPTMSKKEALTAWRKLTPSDREAAMRAVSGFAAYCRQNPDYPPVHACRFLSQRRFEGFEAHAPPDSGVSASDLALVAAAFQSADRAMSR